MSKIKYLFFTLIKKAIILITVFSFFCINVQSQVSIGATPYANIRQAFTAINAGTYSGTNVTVNINASFTDNTTSTLTVAGSYLSVTVKITAANLIITSSAAPFINLSGAHNVIIDGIFSGAKNLTIRQKGNNQVIQFINDAQSCTVQNCYIETNSDDFNGSIYIGNGSSIGNKNITISNNDIRNDISSPPVIGNVIVPTATTNIPNVAIVTSGLSAAAPNSNVTVQNCNIYNFFAANPPIGNNKRVVNVIQNTNNFIFTNNSIYQTVPFYGGPGNTKYTNLVTIGASVNNVTIQGNYFGGNAPLCGGGTYIYGEPISNQRIWLRVIQSLGNSVTIDNNTISNITMPFFRQAAPCGAEDSFRGIYIIGGSATITNNILGSLTAPSALQFSQETNNTGCISPIHLIEWGGGTSGLIQNNKIGGITCSFPAASTLGFDVVGIYVNSGFPNLIISGNQIGSNTLTDNISINNSSSTCLKYSCRYCKYFCLT